MVPLIVVLVLGISTVALLAILLVGLIRHLKLLVASLQRFDAELRPVLDRIQRESEAAQVHGDRLAERGSKLGGDARLRR